MFITWPFRHEILSLFLLCSAREARRGLHGRGYTIIVWITLSVRPLREVKTATRAVHS